MNVNAVADISNLLAQQATRLSAAEVRQAIQMAVLNKALDQQKAEGEALVRLIEGSTAATGSNVDVRV